MVDLIVLDMHDFDIILGMDWLAKNQANIDCQRKRVIIQVPSQRKLIYQAKHKTFDCSFSMNLELKENDFKEIQVVINFPDVFPS